MKEKSTLQYIDTNPNNMLAQIWFIYPIVLFNKIYFNKLCIETYQNGDL